MQLQRRNTNGFKHPRRRWGRLCVSFGVLVAFWLLVAKLFLRNGESMPATEQILGAPDPILLHQRHQPLVKTTIKSPRPRYDSERKRQFQTSRVSADVFMGSTQVQLQATTDVTFVEISATMLSPSLLNSSPDHHMPSDEEDIEELELRQVRDRDRDGDGDGDALTLPQHSMGGAFHDAHRPSGKEASKMSSDTKRFPLFSAFKAQDERADTLPDLIFASFEDATWGIDLQGWEDEWFSDANYDFLQWGLLDEPTIDFVYTWVNGSDKAFTDTIYPYEVNSSLNDVEGTWLSSHKVNRYRDWDELRFSIRTVEKFAESFRGKIMLLVNSVGAEGIAQKATLDDTATIVGHQAPLWLNEDKSTRDTVEIIPQENLFDEDEAGCLPTFDSLTIENQIYNTKSNTDRVSIQAAFSFRYNY